MPVNERFRDLLKAKNISQGEFAEMLDSSRQYVSGLLTGKDAIGMNLLLRLHEFFPDLNMDWFIVGRGEMFIKNEATNYSLRTEIQLAVAEELAKYDLKKKK